MKHRLKKPKAAGPPKTAADHVRQWCRYRGFVFAGETSHYHDVEYIADRGIALLCNEGEYTLYDLEIMSRKAGPMNFKDLVAFCHA